MSLKSVFEFQNDINNALKDSVNLKAVNCSFYSNINQSPEYPFIYHNILNADVLETNLNQISIIGELNIYTREKNHEKLDDIVNILENIFIDEAEKIHNYKYVSAKILSFEFSFSKDTITRRVVAKYESLIQIV